jgi:hypothetical protein
MRGKAPALAPREPTHERTRGCHERYGKLLGDGEIELGKVNEPWDIGLMPAPENPPLQFLLIEKADAELSSMSEAIEMCRAYGEILGGTLEIDVRVLEPSDETS